MYPLHNHQHIKLLQKVVPRHPEEVQQSLGPFSANARPCNRFNFKLNAVKGIYPEVLHIQLQDTICKNNPVQSKLGRLGE